MNNSAKSLRESSDRDCLRDNTGLIASLACLWEASARKVGNVHPRADFANTNYCHFATSALAVYSAFLYVSNNTSIGRIVSSAIDRTRLIVGQNTNLGIMLLLAPLAKAGGGWSPLENRPVGGIYDIREELPSVLQGTTIEDADDVFRAIRDCNPGGLGEVSHHDVRKQATITLLEAMKKAADRDLIARQYANNFADVFDLGIPALLESFAKYGCVEAAIIHCHFTWLAHFPDTLIVRKNDLATAEVVQRRADDIFRCGGLATSAGRAAGVALDAYLRSDGNRLNPGTSADLVAACLFVALREGKLPLNAPFPWQVEDWL